MLSLVLLMLMTNGVALAQDAGALIEIRDALGGLLSSSWGQGSPCAASDSESSGSSSAGSYSDPDSGSYTGSSSWSWGSSSWIGVRCNQSRVQGLDLVAMGLQGTLPSALFSLHSLNYLSLAGNPALGGTIPDAFSSLPLLQHLDLSSCGFSGSVPDSLAHITGLKYLALNNNNLTGPVPSSLGSTGKLTWLDINTNNIAGPLPDVLSLCQSLAHLHLSYNQLNFLPESITTISSLFHLLADNNKFSQPLSTGLRNLDSLQILRLSHNNWTVPNVSAILPPNLIEFYASNAFSGPVQIPDFNKTSPLLEVISLGRNRLSGSVPSFLTSLSLLRSLTLSHNFLLGKVPAISNSSQSSLDLVDLQHNSIQDVSLSDLDQDFTLLLGSNPVCQGSTLVTCKPTDLVLPWLNDTVTTICPDLPCHPSQGTPVLVWGHPVVLPDPILFSSTHTCACHSPLMAHMKLLSPSFTSFTDDLAIDLQYVVFEKLMAASVAGLQQQDQVVIASAGYEKSESIAMFATLLFWQVNEGLDFQAIKSILTNQKVLEQPFGLQYTSQYQDPIEFSGSTNSPGSVSPGAIAGIVVAGVVVLLLVAALILFLLWRATRKLRDDWDSGDYAFLDAIDCGEVRRFTLKDIQAATQDFSPDNLLGQGGYGKVYKGSLPLTSSGECQLVAIKRALPRAKQDVGAFRGEIEMLSGIRHRNLVALLGFCREAGEQVLVYEFAPNGTLDDLLHERSEGSKVLTWQQRMGIAEGAARGLDYLHNSTDPPIIHRDIKPSNILLGVGLVPKVADFGLSRYIPLDNMDSDAVQTLVKGTVGYLDPEYFLSGELTKKSDVYSFGIALLEMATGWGCVQDNRHIRNRVLSEVARGGIMSIMDQSLKDAPVDSRPTTIEFEGFVRVAMQASSASMDRRPPMSAVLAALAELRTCASSGSSSDFKAVGFLGCSSAARAALATDAPDDVFTPQDANQKIENEDLLRSSGGLSLSKLSDV